MSEPKETISVIPGSSEKAAPTREIQRIASAGMPWWSRPSASGSSPAELTSRTSRAVEKSVALIAELVENRAATTAAQSPKPPSAFSPTTAKATSFSAVIVASGRSIWEAIVTPT